MPIAGRTFTQCSPIFSVWRRDISSGSTLIWIYYFGSWILSAPRCSSLERRNWFEFQLDLYYLSNKKTIIVFKNLQFKLNSVIQLQIIFDLILLLNFLLFDFNKRCLSGIKIKLHNDHCGRNDKPYIHDSKQQILSYYWPIHLYHNIISLI